MNPNCPPAQRQGPKGLCGAPGAWPAASCGFNVAPRSLMSRGCVQSPSSGLYRRGVASEKRGVSSAVALVCSGSQTKYHGPGGLTSSSSDDTVNSAGWKSKTKVPSGLVPRGLPPWLVDGRLLPVSSHGHPSVSVCVLICLVRTPVSWDAGPTLGTSFDLLHLFQVTVSQEGRILRCRRLGLPHMNSGGHTQPTGSGGSHASPSSPGPAVLPEGDSGTPREVIRSRLLRKGTAAARAHPGPPRGISGHPPGIVNENAASPGKLGGSSSQQKRKPWSWRSELFHCQGQDTLGRGSEKEAELGCSVRRIWNWDSEREAWFISEGPGPCSAIARMGGWVPLLCGQTAGQQGKTRVSGRKTHRERGSMAFLACVSSHIHWGSR